MKIYIILLISLILSGCTVTNLAPPEPDDALLQRQLNKHFGSSDNTPANSTEDIL